MNADNIEDNQKKLIIITILVIACIIITYIFKIQLDTGRIYTHLFYIPIILACLWWEKRGLIVPVFLALFLVAFRLIFTMEEALVFDFLRAGMFIFIAIFTVHLSAILNKNRREIIETHDNLKKSYKSLRESKKNLIRQSEDIKRAKKELEKRVSELERFHKAVVGRKVRVTELKDIIKHLTEKKIK